ncbi:MAG: methylated-DNA--[protein]-cysteine S-methyltransferase [Coprobacillaceae bacterium]
MTYTTYYESLIGPIMLASDGENIIGLWMKEQKYFANTIKDEVIEKNDLPVFKKTCRWLDAYFAGKNPNISELPLAPEGCDFRKGVLEILCDIPYGEVVTYGDVAKKMAKKMKRKSMSGQAIGGAVGHNPISIIIPCHRVVGGNGSLTGFSGGIDKKLKLLELEGVDITKFIIPTKGTAI